jgi:hypothetical protein
MARWYARQHLETDPGIVSIHYLPKNAPEREIRLLEVNNLLVERKDETLEPFDFGVDVDSESQHRLFVLDVTPQQWVRLTNSKLALPSGWSLDGATVFRPK